MFFAFKVCNMKKDKFHENEHFWNLMYFLIGNQKALSLGGGKMVVFQKVY